MTTEEELVEEMRELSILKGLLDEVPYERYTYFVSHGDQGKDCRYAKLAIKFYRTVCRDKIIEELKKCSGLVSNPG